MNPQPLASFVNQLKGAPASIYLAMLGLDRPTGSEEIALTTGYSTHTVRAALKRLAFLGLARRQSRYQGWVLTEAGYRCHRQYFGSHIESARSPRDRNPCREGSDGINTDGNRPDTTPPNSNAMRHTQPATVQEASGKREENNPPVPAPHPKRDSRTHSPLGNEREIEDARDRENSPVDRKKVPLASCRSCHTHGSSQSSYSRQDTKPSHHEQLTTTWGTDRQKLPVPPPQKPLGSLADDSPAQAAVATLEGCGCPTRMARDAVERAMAHGWRGTEVLEAVKGWFAYAESPEGRTIQHKGFYTMSRLRIGQAAPEMPQASDGVQSAVARDAAARAYIEAQYRRIVQH